ncbi:MAG: hypothetical protein MMC23_003135 [Stictis urceolatum]|nr:hypothetical protein [Stictis urceolata]
MSSSAVGFSFQGDVITGGSLLFNASGRLLKALSDGGVDIYAVAAAVWLGKTMPIEVHHESSIHNLLASRGGRTAFLVKALSIGWGHSDIAVELARTRAGTAALLTIGALATGSSYYTAATGLSELLLLSGCELDRLPNVDALKTLTAYVAPIMVDTGFPKVFEHIVSTIKQNCKISGHLVPEYLLANGEASVWAGAVRQLILTAEKEEQLHFVVRQRGAWLAAYASHILGMAVKVLIQHEVKWECAGPHGSVTFELLPGESNALTSTRQSMFKIIEGPSSEGGNERMSISYDLSSALRTEMSLRMEHPDEKLERLVYELMVRFCQRIKPRVRLMTREGHPVPINGGFDRSSAALEQALVDVGIPLDVVQSTLATEYARGPHLDVQVLSEELGCLVFGVVAAALALMQCVYTAKTLRVDPEVFSGERPTMWLTTILSTGMPSHRARYFKEADREDQRVFLNAGKDYAFAKENSLLLHLSALLQGPQAIKLAEVDRTNFYVQTLAISASNVTILYRAIIDEDCFDGEGRLLKIEPGRVSLNKVLRRFISEHGHSKDVPREEKTMGTVTTMNPGFQVEPHHAPSGLEVVMDTELSENRIWLHTRIHDTGTDSFTSIELTACIECVALWTAPSQCCHGPTRNLLVKRPNQVYVATFGYEAPRDADGVILYALKGSRIEQLIQCGIIGQKAKGMCVMQLQSCLSCSYKAKPNRMSNVSHIIMAS